MDKLDPNNSEFGGLTLTVKILIGIIVLILMAATTFGMYLAYNNCDNPVSKLPYLPLYQHYILLSVILFRAQLLFWQ